MKFSFSREALYSYYKSMPSIAKSPDHNESKWAKESGRMGTLFSQFAQSTTLDMLHTFCLRDQPLNLHTFVEARIEMCPALGIFVLDELLSWFEPLGDISAHPDPLEYDKNINRTKNYHQDELLYIGGFLLFF
jgi:hypothetical protein